MELCYVFFGLSGFFLLLYVLLELHYFLRSLACILCAKICKKRLHVLEETRVNGICLTSDIDTLWNHMNNARYIRELDFAKLEFYERTGLYQHVRNIGGSLAMGATTIRYRRYIKVFSRYYITTKVIYWDDKGIYIEHKFVSPKDNFINAVVMCKVRLINCSVEDVMSDFMAIMTDGDDPKRQKPEITPELEKWIECNEISSANLRSELKV